MYVAGDAVEVREQLRGQHLGGRTLADDLAFAHRDESVTDQGGLIDVVKHHHDGPVGLLIELPHERHDLELVGDIQVGGRLVEQQDRCLLGENHRDPGPLPLSAGEMVDLMVAEVRHPGQFECVGDGEVVSLGRGLEKPLVRVAAAADEILDGDVAGRRCLLR